MKIRRTLKIILYIILIPALLGGAILIGTVVQCKDLATMNELTFMSIVFLFAFLMTSILVTILIICRPKEYWYTLDKLYEAKKECEDEEDRLFEARKKYINEFEKRKQI